jgi:hypothetical protein
MKYLNIFILLFCLVINPLSGQEKPEIQSNCITNYINSRVPKDLSTLEYLSGYYVTPQNDTIITKISFLKRIGNYVFFVAQIDSAHYSILNAMQVKSYSLDGKTYFSYPLSQMGSGISVFISQEVAGKIDLYLKPSLPFDKTSYYLLNKKPSIMMYSVNPFSSSTYSFTNDNQKFIVDSKSTEGSHMQSIGYQEANLDNSFKELIPSFVGDCELLMSKINSEFYSQKDIVRIVKEYNSCEQNSKK